MRVTSDIEHRYAEKIGSPLLSAAAPGSSKPLALTSGVKRCKSNQIAANERCAWDLTMRTGWHFSSWVRYDRCKSGEGVRRVTRKAWSPNSISEVDAGV